MKTYFRLLSFAKPIEKYAVPYIICTLITVVFSTLNLALLAPLLQTLFNTDQVSAQAVLEKPKCRSMTLSKTVLRKFNNVCIRKFSIIRCAK